jgi:hypothetical protein
VTTCGRESASLQKTGCRNVHMAEGSDLRPEGFQFVASCADDNQAAAGVSMRAPVKAVRVKDKSPATISPTTITHILRLRMGRLNRQSSFLSSPNYLPKLSASYT